MYIEEPYSVKKIKASTSQRSKLLQIVPLHQLAMPTNWLRQQIESPGGRLHLANYRTWQHDESL